MTAVPGPSAALAPPSEPLANASAACGRGEALACARLLTWAIQGRSAAEMRGHQVAATEACRRGVADGCAVLGLVHLKAAKGPAEVPGILADIQRACDAGSSGGCSIVGEMYLRGRGVAADLPRATKLIRDACTRLGGSACYTLALQLGEGLGVPRDEARARALLDDACGKGVPESCMELGMMHDEGGLGVPKNRALALELYRRACAVDFAPACYNLGLHDAQTPSEQGRARDELTKACLWGDAGGCDYLASTNDLKVVPAHNGRDEGVLGTTGAAGAPPAFASDEEQLPVLRRYCALGGRDACADLGVALSERADNATVVEEMVGGLLTGCERGSMRACNLAGSLAKQVIKACAAGDGGSCFGTGLIYARGLSMPRANGPSIDADAARAKETFARACKLGIVEACARAR